MRDDELWRQIREGLRRQRLLRLVEEYSGMPAAASRTAEEGGEGEPPGPSPDGCAVPSPSGCTAVQPETAEEEGAATGAHIRPAPGAGERSPFCFARRRMKRSWRNADRLADAGGVRAARTIGSSRARMDWFSLLRDAILRDRIIRVRHQNFDEPVLLMRESRFREMERRRWAGS